MPFALGCVLAYGRLGVAQLNEETLKEAALQQEMQKVEMIETESISVSEHDRTHYPEGSIVTVINKSNEKIRLFNGAATGMPVKPMSDNQLNDKFMSCAETQLTPEQARALLKRLRSIEKVVSINDLFGD
jgi:2-methylcitrate dehydratase PrpD